MTGQTHNNDNLHSDDGKIAHAHDPRYGINLMIWLILISLTVITVAVAGIDLGEYTLFVAMLVAAVKSSFVINYFMHIKFEDLMFKLFLILVIMVLFVVFVLTGFDVFYR
jgi:cytochrome c oxidase subunit 4